MFPRTYTYYRTQLCGPCVQCCLSYRCLHPKHRRQRWTYAATRDLEVFSFFFFVRWFLLLLLFFSLQLLLTTATAEPYFRMISGCTRARVLRCCCGILFVVDVVVVVVAFWFYSPEGRNAPEYAKKDNSTGPRSRTRRRPPPVCDGHRDDFPIKTTALYTARPTYKKTATAPERHRSSLSIQRYSHEVLPGR